MTREEFVKFFNQISNHNQKSIAIEKALCKDFLEEGCIVKYGGRLEECAIEMLSLLSDIDKMDITTLIYEGELLGEQPNSIIKYYINTPEALYDFYKTNK